MSSEISIKVDNLSKCYHIYDQPRDRLKQFILPRLQKMLGVNPKQYFREFWALNNVSFEVKRGETVGIVGRNGGGKSTLLQLICGTLNPTHGTVETKGRIAALLELGSGFNPEFTGRENVYMNAAVLGLSTSEVDARFDDIASFADIGNFIEQPVKKYSSGMMLRLAFAVQVAIDPDILIVDEALAVGDEKFQRKCFSRLEDLKSKGTSVLFVSHSASSIIELCDRALLIDGGSRLMYGVAPQIVRSYQKLIYAPPSEYERLINCYKKADNEGDLESIDKLTNSLTADNSVKTARSSTEFFDAGLVPETTTVYPTQGAEIKSFDIYDAKHNKVNILERGETYRIEVSGEFHDNFSGLFWGIHIKTISGTVATGQRYPEEGKFYENIKSGSTFKISFYFTMNLLSGIYFVGGGIWSAHEPECPHRILDAIMFRVLPPDYSGSFGTADLMAEIPSLEISRG
ncbi:MULTISPECIES: ABC transporter ATP-binding protein [Pseudomonas]|uniref:ABC transporter ATP-binding protein n=1 Tax=Pseudomonas luteola TaxID=47886 RepID=A0A2X2CXZ8_PSELU|nr:MULTISPECIES: ABC transporter ATP-binding protein [Pseudomonas]ENA32566.1 hypothetical protein HMPREF1487_06288 [Pseudomonas sp. HPB0071]MBA1248918.1 ABC transporter ATP-binding protein [Pseudomonas zeshuii]MBF8641493.1 ABC transporter ATP-binding protein [Pseudomonas zeshuii]QEU30753.1 ABC transporter ATP-binding protein [Pseudomonas luteola]RRW47629.1 ABC transporter ATP-binding protein [Pseudomonas luteola]